MLTALEKMGERRIELEDLMNVSDPQKKVKNITAMFKEFSIDRITQNEIDRYYEKGLRSIDGIEMDHHWKTQLLALITKLMGRQS